MSRRGLLWIAFLGAHLLVAAAGWWWPNMPMGDVYLVYQPWAASALSGQGIVGIDEPFVYPVVALVPMMLTQAVAAIADGSVGLYTLTWPVLVTLLDAVAFGVLVGSARSRGRVAAAWFWVAFLIALGPVGLYRIDAVTVPLAILALLWVARRPFVAGLLLAVATWMKVWPAALVVAAVVAVRRRLWLIAGGAVVTAVVVGSATARGGAREVWSFVTEQGGRGLQVEAPVSMLYVWMAGLGSDSAFVFYDREILTFQATGPQVDTVITVMTPLLALAALAVTAIGVRKAWLGASYARLLPPLGLALVLVLIVFNKVGSPQFQTWLIAPVVLWLVLDRRAARTPALVSLGIAALTQLVYPVLYGAVLSLAPVALAVLTVRNIALVALLAIVIVRLVRVPTVGRPSRPSAVHHTERGPHADRILRRP